MFGPPRPDHPDSCILQNTIVTDLPPNPRSRLIAIIAYTALALLFAEFTRHALKHAYPGTDQTKGDFLAFYEAAEAMRTGGDLYLERHRNYIYPPLVAFLYMPLTFFSDPPTLHRTAGIIALLVNVGMAIATVFMFASESLRRLISYTESPTTVPPTAAALSGRRCESSIPSNFPKHVLPLIVLLATLLIADKLRSELRMWQTNVLMLFFIALGLRFLDRRPTLAGAMLGFAVNIKYLPILLLPWLLLRRRFAAAGGMVLGILAGAFAPALWVGWSKNIEYLRSGFAGLLGLFGIAPPQGTSHAVMEDIAGGLSVSLTSAFARALGGSQHATGALAISGCIAVLVAGAAAFAYYKRRLPILAWPTAAAQAYGPFPALVLLEASAIIIALLVFGPQTNPRHLCMMLLPAAAAATLIILPFPPRVRIAALIGAVLLVSAMSLPPGGTESMDHLVGEWRRISGPSYGMLAMLAALVWTVTSISSAKTEKQTNQLHT